ncbi:MAG TPA: sigma-54 dependent transcriptional regulator [Longimicrobium sp.]|jgi:DNA-binding NtrC family response regulator|uniref:sigma-54 dependent transcriptional regulator n=1 Tax=Longimicrobium sp. TaxID=2029185 RepID=UPI002ED94CA0
MADRTVLLIGDDAEVRDAVRAACQRAGAGLSAAATLGDGLRALSASRHDATVLLASAVDEDGAVIRRIAAAPHAGTLVLVARAPSLRLAIEAPRLGAAELLTVPLDVDRLAALLSPAPPGGDVVALPPPAAASGDELVGSSPALVEAFQTVGRVAGSDATVLVTGESGTGKELVARALHAASRRAGGAFVAVNCAAIPEDLLESELFGHERGAFTGAVARKVGRFERANGGTLFLDEIGDMSLVLQAKILRALQEREIERLGGEERIRLDVRVVAATHRDLPSLIASGDFREDLFYRLAVVRLHLPALRERPGDVRALALHYAARFAGEHGRELRGIAGAALRSLEAHAWPGNVRELRNVLERAVLLAPGDVLQVEHLQLGPAAAPAKAAEGGAESLPGYSLGMTMAQAEALHIGQVLRQVDGHFGRAAEILDMHRNTVSRKAIEYGVIPG